MIRYIILLCFTIVSMNSAAQDSFFKEAISKGCQANGAYYIDNKKKKKIIGAEELKRYAKQKGYIIGEIKKENVVRFGDVATTVTSFEFIFPNDYKKYIFYALCGNGMDYNQLNSVGTLFLTNNNRFLRYDNILWSSNVSGGLIDGSGVGFLPSLNPSGTYMLFKGTFSMGIPKSKCYISNVTKNDLNNGHVYSNEIAVSEQSPVSQDVMAANSNTSDDKLKQALKFNLSDNSQYQMLAEKVEAAYNKAKNINMSNYKDLAYDNAAAQFIQTYGGIGYDPQNLLSKAKELNDVYIVAQELRIPVRNQYWGEKIYLFVPTTVWFEKEEKNDRARIQNAYAVAEKWKDNSKYGFKNFYGQAYLQLKQKKSDFEEKIKRDQKSLNNLYASRNAAREGKYFQPGTVEIDRITPPSGDLESGLFETYYHFEKEGKITFRKRNGFATGGFVTYNAYYRDSRGGELVEYYILFTPPEINSSKLKKFGYRNEAELLEDIRKLL